MEYKFSTNLAYKIEGLVAEVEANRWSWNLHYKRAHTFVLRPDALEAHDARQHYWWKRYKASQLELAKARALHLARQPRRSKALAK